MAVAGLFGINLKKLGFEVEPLTFLPPMYASINGLTAIVLIAAVIAIKKGNKKITRAIKITFAIGCSLVFLLLYIGYHMTSDSTTYGGEGTVKIYFTTFIFNYSILYLSIVVIPFVINNLYESKIR